MIDGRWTYERTPGEVVARYDERSIADRETVQLGMQVDPTLKQMWDDHRQAAADRMGVDDLTNELFASMLLDVYAHHLDDE